MLSVVLSIVSFQLSMVAFQSILSYLILTDFVNTTVIPCLAHSMNSGQEVILAVSLATACTAIFRSFFKDVPNIRFVFTSVPNNCPNSLFVFGRIASS